MLTDVVTHGAAALLGFASSAALSLIERRRTKAINATRALTVFFMRNLKKLGAPESSIIPQKVRLLPKSLMMAVCPTKVPMPWRRTTFWMMESRSMAIEKAWRTRTSSNGFSRVL